MQCYNKSKSKVTTNEMTTGSDSRVFYLWNNTFMLARLHFEVMGLLCAFHMK